LDNQLRDSIEDERCQMVSLADHKGMQHREVIRVSQALDKLLNDYYHHNS